ncbi:hypothetical protein [Cellulomonas soli]|uniref:Immunity protein 63 domain-containing protein n=1 Tax=Cellulomonas soli TaxID=931535 RepID=A0A512PG27_9CELL|nr:hypothetical protein [Cellulomonas soli]NYI58019.1 hypothetical protein [Cellulomonas soli]GEP70154.1 hypothetical protein CSO01_28690 [Cellulomonas soli]
MEFGRHAPPELVALYDECVALGYWPSEDFDVRGMPGGSNGDVIAIRREGGTYIIWSEDNGRPHEMLRTDDFTTARELFLTQVGWHAGARGIGPYAGRNRLEEEGWTRLTEDERVLRVYREMGKPPPAYLRKDEPGE